MATEIPPEIFYANRGLPNSNVQTARILNNRLATLCRRLLLQDHAAALRQTAEVCYPPISLLLSKINIARRMFNDDGKTWGTEKIYWIASNEEWNLCFPLNTGDMYRFWDGRNQVIAVHNSVRSKKTWMQCLRTARPDLVLSCALFANHYLKQQYITAIRDIDKHTEFIQKLASQATTDKTSVAEQKFPEKYVLAPKRVRKIMYVDNAVLITNEKSPKHDREPLVYFKFYVGSITISEDCIATKIGMPRNALKAAMIDVFDDDSQSTKDKKLKKLLKKEKKRHFDYESEYNHDAAYAALERNARISRLETQATAQRKYAKYKKERKALRQLLLDVNDSD